MSATATGRQPQRGVLLIEALVAMMVCAFALLGFVAMQARASNAELEALARSQALVLVNDMVGRINTNRANAGAYVSADLIGEGVVVSCNGLAGAALDLCEWGNLIRGSTEVRGSTRLGAMPLARGCITRAAGSSDRYVIAVAWLGVVATGAPTGSCAQGSTGFGDDSLRRVVSISVCMGRLRDPVVVPGAPPPAARC